jgi:hypothetical protein
VYGCLHSPVLVQSEIERQERRGERRDKLFLIPKRLKKLVGEEVEEGSRRMRRMRHREEECDKEDKIKSGGGWK